MFLFSMRFCGLLCVFFIFASLKLVSLVVYWQISSYLSCFVSLFVFIFVSNLVFCTIVGYCLFSIDIWGNISGVLDRFSHLVVCCVVKHRDNFYRRHYYFKRDYNLLNTCFGNQIRLDPFPLKQTKAVFSDMPYAIIFSAQEKFPFAWGYSRTECWGRHWDLSGKR